MFNGEVSVMQFWCGSNNLDIRGDGGEGLENVMCLPRNDKLSGVRGSPSLFELVVLSWFSIST